VLVKLFLSSWNLNKASFKMSIDVASRALEVKYPDANILPPDRLVPSSLYSIEELTPASVHVPPEVTPEATTCYL
jgi:hypothetical protein